MAEYRIKISNEKRKTYQLMNLIILLISLALFILSAISVQDGLSFVAYLGALLNAIAISWHFKFRRKNPGSKIPFFFLLLSSICWFTIGRWPAAIMLLLFAVMEFFVNRELEIIFDENGIRYPSFPEKRFMWNEVDQALIKDGILTIDLKDNRLYQFNLSSESQAGIDVAGFNEYCRGMKA